MALGLIEVSSWTATLVAIDRLEKAADVRLVQVELNDRMGACVKIDGPVAAVQSAIDSAEQVCRQMNVDVVSDVIARPAAGAEAAHLAPVEFNPLIEQHVVHAPAGRVSQEASLAEQAPFAIGIIETQGLTAVIQAIDTAAKAANVEVLGREKLGGGYIAVVLKGDVAAVKAAVEAGQAAVGDLGKLIAAHVIARPSAAVLGLLQQR